MDGLPFSDGVFDRVLVDAPCTGTGTLRRNPEIRWRLAAADIPDLAAKQLQILKRAARVVKQGGRLIYSTCSIEREENEEVIDRFMKETHGYKQVELPVYESLLTSPFTARVWPQRDGADGFFIAAFERISSL